MSLIIRLTKQVQRCAQQCRMPSQRSTRFTKGLQSVCSMNRELVQLTQEYHLAWAKIWATICFCLSIYKSLGSTPLSPDLTTESKRLSKQRSLGQGLTKDSIRKRTCNGRAPTKTMLQQQFSRTRPAEMTSRVTWLIKRSNHLWLQPTTSLRQDPSSRRHSTHHCHLLASFDSLTYNLMAAY